MFNDGGVMLGGESNVQGVNDSDRRVLCSFRVYLIISSYIQY